MIAAAIIHQQEVFGGLCSVCSKELLHVPKASLAPDRTGLFILDVLKYSKVFFCMIVTQLLQLPVCLDWINKSCCCDCEGCFRQHAPLEGSS